MPEGVTLSSPFVIVGEEDVVSGFRALGFKVYPLKAQEELKLILRDVVKEGCAVCLVEDSFYNSGRAEINNYRSLALPIFIPFAKNLKEDLLEELAKDIRLRATGTF